MSNIRDLGHKINSLKNMQKVMRAMNMISSIKLRKLYPVQDPLSLFDRSIEGMRVRKYTVRSAVPAVCLSTGLRQYSGFT